MKRNAIINIFILIISISYIYYLYTESANEKDIKNGVMDFSNKLIYINKDTDGFKSLLVSSVNTYNLKIIKISGYSIGNDLYFLSNAGFKNKSNLKIEIENYKGNLLQESKDYLENFYNSLLNYKNISVSGKTELLDNIKNDNSKHLIIKNDGISYDNKLLFDLIFILKEKKIDSVSFKGFEKMYGSNNFNNFLNVILNSKVKVKNIYLENDSKYQKMTDSEMINLFYIANKNEKKIFFLSKKEISDLKIETNKIVKDFNISNIKSGLDAGYFINLYYILNGKKINSINLENTLINEDVGMFIIKNIETKYCNFVNTNRFVTSMYIDNMKTPINYNPFIFNDYIKQAKEYSGFMNLLSDFLVKNKIKEPIDLAFELGEVNSVNLGTYKQRISKSKKDEYFNNFFIKLQSSNLDLSKNQDISERIGYIPKIYYPENQIIKKNDINGLKIYTENYSFRFEYNKNITYKENIKILYSNMLYILAHDDNNYYRNYKIFHEKLEELGNISMIKDLGDYTKYLKINEFLGGIDDKEYNELHFAYAYGKIFIY